MTVTAPTHSTPPRRREDICPTYCAGHDDRFQPWEDASIEGQVRDHYSMVEYVGRDSIGVMCGATEFSGARMSEGQVIVLTGADARYLSPAHARDLASVLNRAADRVEAQA